MTTPHDPIVEFYGQTSEHDWQSLELLGTQCLLKCNPESLSHLLRGEEACGVL
jgi:hypothetical protein